MNARGYIFRRALPGLVAITLFGVGLHRAAPPDEQHATLHPDPVVVRAAVTTHTSPWLPARRSVTALNVIVPSAAVAHTIPYAHRADEALVVAVPGHFDEVVAHASRTLGARLLGRVGTGDVAHLALPTGTDLPRALARLRGLPGVLDASPNALTRGASWPDASMLARVRPSMLWNLTAARWTSGSARGVTVALLDSGVAYRDHVDARGVSRARAPWLDGVTIVSPRDALHGDDAPDDVHNHGTHLASILVGYPGLAAGAALMPVQVLGDDLGGTEAALVAGLDWARTHGARVVNLSLAFGRGYYPSRALDRAVAEAQRAGMILVAAAGNGSDDDVRYPAAFPGVLAVGAGALDGPATAPMVTARYATTGHALDLLAPGGDLARDLNRDGVPDGILGVTFDPAAPTRFAPWLFAGSSQATAHATAAAARLLAQGVPAAEVIARLCAGARPLGRGRGFDASTGFGSLDMSAPDRGGQPPERVAVQLVGALVRREAGVGVVAGVAVRGRDGSARRNREVLARWRGAVEGAASCTTDRDGVCYLDGGALAEGSPRVALLEVQGVVDPDGEVTRPDEVFWSDHEITPAVHTLESVDDEAMLLWRVPAGSGVIPGVTALDTLLMRGVAAGTALAPTVVVLDAPAFALATSGGDTSGVGFGRSSVDPYFFAYDSRWFAGAADSLWTSGLGFGRSSLPDDLTFTYDWSWDAWGSLGALNNSLFAPSMVIGVVYNSRAASADGARLRGAGEGIPLP